MIWTVRKPKKPKMPDPVLEFFRTTGAMGGKARAERHTAEELTAWGKLGGRPKGSGKKRSGRPAKKGEH
jgi:hypothetical protein